MGKGSPLSLAVRITGVSSHVKPQRVRKPVIPRLHQTAYYGFLIKRHDEKIFSYLREKSEAPGIFVHVQNTIFL